MPVTLFYTLFITCISTCSILLHLDGTIPRSARGISLIFETNTPLTRKLMKYSIYNSIIPLTQVSSMLYNAADDRFIIFRKELEPLIKEGRPEELEAHSGELYAQFLEGGALVEESVDEVGKMTETADKINNDPSTYTLIVNPTMSCNFKCWYCYETHRPGSKMTEETIEAVQKLISNIIDGKKEHKNISLSFFGGEPLLFYKDTVQPLIDCLRRECGKADIDHHIQFTSNGFLINDRILEHLMEFDDPKSFQITLDGHREQHNKVRFSTSGGGSYDRIIANIKKLLANKIRVVLRINYTMENARSIKNIVNDLKDIDSEERKYLKIDFQKVWQDNEIKDGNESLLDESLSAFKNEFLCVTDHYNNVDSLRSPCYADYTHEAIINYNGDVFKCTARDFTSDNRCGHLSDTGEIIWDDPEYMNKRQCSKFQKQTCRQCRIFPLCGGSCSQNAIESSGEERCIRNYSELDKDKIILARFYNKVVKHEQHEGTTL